MSEIAGFELEWGMSTEELAVKVELFPMIIGSWKLFPCPGCWTFG